MQQHEHKHTQHWHRIIALIHSLYEWNHTLICCFMNWFIPQPKNIQKTNTDNTRRVSVCFMGSHEWCMLKLNDQPKGLFQSNIFQTTWAGNHLHYVVKIPLIATVIFQRRYCTLEWFSFCSPTTYSSFWCQALLSYS